MIDIGGPAMLRAAAKNFAHVAPVAKPERYERDPRSSCARRSELSLETRRRLAAEAFALTAAYEAAIANWFAEPEAFPDAFMPGVREGARPRLRREPAPARRLLLRAERPAAPALAVEQLHGRELSFNNLNDLDAARAARARVRRSRPA